MTERLGCVLMILSSAAVIVFGIYVADKTIPDNWIIIEHNEPKGLAQTLAVQAAVAAMMRNQSRLKAREVFVNP